MLKQRQVAAFKKHSKIIDLNKYVISKRKKRHFFISNTLKGQCLDDGHCVGKPIFRIERPRVPKDLDDNKFPFHPSSGSLLNSWTISKTCDIWLREM